MIPDNHFQIVCFENYEENDRSVRTNQSRVVPAAGDSLMNSSSRFSSLSPCIQLVQELVPTVPGEHATKSSRSLLLSPYVQLVSYEYLVQLTNSSSRFSYLSA